MEAFGIEHCPHIMCQDLEGSFEKPGCCLSPIRPWREWPSGQLLNPLAPVVRLEGGSEERHVRHDRLWDALMIARPIPQAVDRGSILFVYLRLGH